MWTPDPKLIDWEYARLGDPADEIAYTFDQNSLSDSQRRAFWTGYLKATGNQLAVGEIARRTTWWLPVTLLGSALWWAEHSVRRTELETLGGSTLPSLEILSTTSNALPRELDGSEHFWGKRPSPDPLPSAARSRFRTDSRLQ